MKRTALLLCFLLMFPYAIFAAEDDVQVPDDIRNTLEDFHQDIVLGDIDSAATYISDIALLQLHFAGLGQQGNVLRLSERYDLEALQVKFVECRVNGDWALVEYDLTIRGTNKKAGEQVQKVWRQLQRLRRQGPGWIIMETMRLAPDREETSIKEGRLVDAATGIRVPIPENWSAGIIHGMANVVGTCDAPDLQTSISVFAMNVPVELSAKAIARAGTASQKRFGAEVKVLSQGDTQLAGEKAYQMRTKITLGDIAMRSHQVFRVDKRNGNRTLYALSYSSFSPTGLDDFQAQFDEVTEGLEIVEPVQQALPPEVGTVADGRYINREY